MILDNFQRVEESRRWNTRVTSVRLQSDGLIEMVGKVLVFCSAAEPDLIIASRLAQARVVKKHFLLNLFTANL